MVKTPKFNLEQLTKIPLAKKVAVLCLLAVLVGGGYWYFWYGDLFEEKAQLARQYGKLQKDFKDAERRKKTYDDDRRRRDELKKNYAQQLRALPSKAEMSSFLNNLNTQAEMVGLEIQHVKPLEEEATQYYARIPVKLRLSGTYHQLAKFFYLVGSLERVINIEDIALRKASLDESGAVLNADVMATTFRSVQPGEKAAGKKGKKKKKKKKR